MRLLPLFGFMLASSLFAQSDALTVPLWPETPPGAREDASYQEQEGAWEGPPRIPYTERVSQPRLEVFLPPADRATGAAVVICPGGGYGLLAHAHEGRDFARWFQARGVAGIVLFYRLPSDRIMEHRAVGPLQDVQEAIRVARRQAGAWHLDPRKIGVMGFSAGGHLAATASTLYRDSVYPVPDGVSARPDFSLLVYGVLSFQDALVHRGSRENLLGREPSAAQRDHFSNELQVDAETPPAFLIHAVDDNVVPVGNSEVYHAALRRHGVPSELHLYEVGGHGFGMAGACGHWVNDLAAWMARHGWARP
jgi:acetyl esterase/lipase